MPFSKNQIYIVSFCLGLILFGTWSGQTFLDLGFIGLCAVWIFNSWKLYKTNPELKWKSLGLRKSGIDWLILIYFVIACLGYAINGREGAEPMKYLPRFSTFLQIYVLMWVFERIRIHYKKALKIFTIAILFPSLYATQQWFVGLQTNPDFRVEGLLKSSIQHAYVGGFLVILFGLIFIKNITKLSTVEKLIYGSAFLLTLASTAFTRTRGVLIVLVFILGLVILERFKPKIRVSLVGLGLVLAGLFWISPYKNLVIRGYSDHCRKELYRAHFRMIEDKPILGIGYLDNYREIKDYWPLEGEYICKHEREGAAHAHNQYVNVAATTGIPSLFIFLAMFGYFLLLTFKILKNTQNFEIKQLSAVAMYLQIYFMLAGMTEIPFEYAKIRILILLVWAWVAVAYTQTKDESKILT